MTSPPDILDHVSPPNQDQPSRRRNLFRRLLIASGGIFFLILAGAIFVYFYIFANLPKLNKLTDYRPSLVTEVYARDLTKFAEYSNERRFLVDFEDLPKPLVYAFIASEDNKFFQHEGIDYGGIARAFMKNLLAGRIVQGGSTITQQVAKSLLLTSERSFRRKLKEVILAHRIEKNLSKEEILYLYLNQIYLGHGAYGVQAAAQSYFRKDVTDLTLSESAFLAGLPQAPSRYSPFRSQHKAKERQRYVLEQMQENGFISEFERLSALQDNLKIYHLKDPATALGADFAEWARRHVQEKYGDEALYTGGLQVFTTLDLAKQEMAERAVRKGLEELDHRQGYRGIEQHLDVTDSKAVEEFLHEVHEKANAEEFIIVPGESETGADPAPGPPEPTRIQPEKWYPALITDFDTAGRHMTVHVGTVQGRVQLEDMKWAREPNDEVRFEEAAYYVKDPRKKFKQGDVILVVQKTLSPEDLKSKKYEKDQIYFSLAQKPMVQGALISMDPATGSVLAMVGGYDFRDSEFNRATQGVRQPGSAFKPIIYAAALDKGYTPSSVIVDSPIVFQSTTEEEESVKWRPKNYGNKFLGDTTFRQALVKSMNVITIKILQDIGVSYVSDYARNLGITSPLAQDLSLALGSSDVSLLELTKVYGVFQMGGRPSEPVFLTKILDRHGRALERVSNHDYDLSLSETVASLKEHIEEKQIQTPLPQAPLTDAATGGEEGVPSLASQVPPGYRMSPQTAYLITHLMTDVVQYGTGQRVKELGRPVAGKTGTTNDEYDAWFIGFTPDILTGVWVGFDQKKPLGKGETGGRAATPLWLAYMKEAVTDSPIRTFEVPEGIVFAWVNKKTGYLANADTPPNLKILGAYREGTQPTSDEGPRPSLTEDEFFLIDSQIDDEE